jgi:TolB protein
MAQTTTSGWWERERQRFLKRILICLVLVLLLIGYFTYINMQGRTGIVGGVNFATANYIAFVRREADGTSAICAIRADGTDLRLLTNAKDPSNKEHPSWTPDGKNLVFSSNMKDLQTTQLYVLGGGAPVQLTYGSGNKFSPVVSPNGRIVAFITQGVVKTVSITGTEVTQVMPLPRSGNEVESTSLLMETEMGPYLSAAFAHDGLTLAGVQDVSNSLIRSQDAEATPSNVITGSKIRALPVDQQVVVLPGSANKPYPPVAQGHEVSMAWEPNGTRLACTYTELPMLDKDGKPVDTQGKLLPKGSKEQPISGIQIFSFDNDRPTHQPIFACLGYSVEPKNIAWASDGNRLAFEVWRIKGEGVRELAGIQVLDIKESGVDAKGTPIYQGFKVLPESVNKLTYLVTATAQTRPQNPRWSPDGRRLLYEVTDQDGKRDIWIINSDGTNPKNLTKGHGDNYDATWSPAQ